MAVSRMFVVAVLPAVIVGASFSGVMSSVALPPLTGSMHWRSYRCR
jgi:hypothetical protein